MNLPKKYLKGTKISYNFKNNNAKIYQELFMRKIEIDNYRIIYEALIEEEG